MKTRIIYFIFILILSGCKSNNVEPEKVLDISGYYQSLDNTMFLSLLKQSDNKEYKGLIKWNSTAISIQGVLDKKNLVLTLTGNVNGFQNLSYQLEYVLESKELKGVYQYNLGATNIVKFKFLYLLKAHDQGGFYE